ncbi:glycosyltransferase-like protein gnt15 [Vespa crabro]|uniref:glycosyltransferase-like protein gnt15 n=1 Tax=Vespa crabro TaxID=7445 RepID=UPI001F016595|nr:glycosyltransferase-like protein gnt15 [Vespa crabro]
MKLFAITSVTWDDVRQNGRHFLRALGGILSIISSQECQSRRRTRDTTLLTYANNNNNNNNNNNSNNDDEDDNGEDEDNDEDNDEERTESARIMSERKQRTKDLERKLEIKIEKEWQRLVAAQQELREKREELKILQIRVNNRNPDVNQSSKALRQQRD